MSKITKATLLKAYKPFDIVSIEKSVGYITEVKFTTCQVGFNNQVGYSVCWLIDTDSRHSAWYAHKELNRHCNLFVKIAENACNAFSDNSSYVKKLFNIN